MDWLQFSIACFISLVVMTCLHLMARRIKKLEAENWQIRRTNDWLRETLDAIRAKGIK